MKNMKRIISIILVLSVVLIGCQKNEVKDEVKSTTPVVTQDATQNTTQDIIEDELEVIEPVEPIHLKVIMPYGTPTLSMVPLMVENTVIADHVTLEYETIESTDVLTAALINEEADIAVVPTNLAAVLYNRGVNYQLAGTGVWGVLYLVAQEGIESVEDLRGETIDLIGRNLTPDAMLRYILEGNGIDSETDVTLNYFEGTSELATAYISEQSNLAMIPEPVLTNVLMRREGAKVVLNLQEEWTKLTGLDNYPQASLIISKNLIDNHPEIAKAFMVAYGEGILWINENPAEAGAYYESLGIGLNAAIIEKAIPGASLNFIPASTARPMIDGYLDVLFNFNENLLGGQMIDEAFYFEE